MTLLLSRFLSRRGLRLACGIVLFTCVATHLANHAAGLISLAAAEEARLWFIAAWRRGAASHWLRCSTAHSSHTSY